MSARKVGGIWFMRLGRLQFSFCVVSRTRSARAIRWAVRHG